MTAPLVATAPSDTTVIGDELARMARMAKAMPPAWDGAKVMHNLTGSQGENLGRVLPGRGIALASDLKSIGITKPIPFVFEKTLTMRCVEACGGRERLALSAAAVLASMKLGALGMADALSALPMMAGAITTYDGIINGRANGKGQDTQVYLSSQTSVSSTWHSFLRSTTKFPAGTFAPANIPGGTAPNRDTVGSIILGLSNPTGGDKKYLLTMGYSCSNTLNIVLLVDLLMAAANVNSNVTTNTVNSTALTRYVSGAGVLTTLEVTSALGVTASDVTMTYTSQSNLSQSTTATAMTTSAIAGRLQPTQTGPFMRLANGDWGVRSVQSVNFSLAMGAGALNLYQYYPLHFLPGIANNIYIERDSTLQIDGLTELVTGTDSELGFLAVFGLPSSTTTGNLTAFLRTVSG